MPSKRAIVPRSASQDSTPLILTGRDADATPPQALILEMLDAVYDAGRWPDLMRRVAAWIQSEEPNHSLPPRLDAGERIYENAEAALAESLYMGCCYPPSVHLGDIVIASDSPARARRLDAIMPFLRRTTALALTLDRHSRLGSALSTATDVVAVLCVDESLRLIAHSDAWGFLIPVSQLIAIRDGFVVSQCAQHIERLEGAVHRALVGTTTTVVLSDRCCSVRVRVSPAERTLSASTRGAYLICTLLAHVEASAFEDTSLAPALRPIARGLVQGQGAKDIASELGKNLHTVQKYIKRTYAWAKVSGQDEFARAFHQGRLSR